MSLVHYNPWGNLRELQNEINRLFSGFDEADSSAITAGWTPAADIREYGNHFQLFVDLPGVDPDSVELTLENGILTIGGERHLPDRAGGEEMISHRAERAHGKFHRRFVLPATVDADGVEATDRNGVLEITIPKQASAQPRRIEVAA